MHLEYVVLGPPISNQATGTRGHANLSAWKAKVKAAARKLWTAAPLKGKLKVILINFHEGEKPSLDVDNMSKPVHDVMNKLVYEDDRQIRQAEISHVRIDDPMSVAGASKMLVDAVQKASSSSIFASRMLSTHSHSQSDLMEFDQQLEQIVKRYAAEGYQTFVRPGPAALPPFAKDFKVDILAKRGDGGVLAQVKRNRQDLAADSDTPRYAEITNNQPGWRFDFFVLEGENPLAREPRDAKEFSGDDIRKALADAEELARAGFLRPAAVTAWAALEAAMRMRLRAAGENAGWGTMPRSLLNELYSSGVFSEEEFSKLEKLSHLRNQIVHGFSSSTSIPEAVQVLSDTARRLLDESEAAEQSCEPAMH